MANLPLKSTEFERAFVLQAILDLKPRVYCELGSHRGGSLQTYGSLVGSGGTCIVVNLWTMAKVEAASLQKTLNATAAGLRRAGTDVRVIEGDSTDKAIVEAVRKAIPNPIDVLFIDSGHESHEVAADAHNYAPMVRSGGLVIFHDVGFVHAALPPDLFHYFDGCHNAYRYYARGKKTLMVHEDRGYGLVWKP